MSYKQLQGERTRQFYANDRGIGFFCPSAGEVISGITRVYGLAYIDEGWHELERGVGRVEITVGGKPYSASLYVKDRYFVFVFDSTDFPDGELEFRASAWDKENNPIGTVSMTALVCNSGKPSGRRLYASPDGTSDGDGSREKPWDAVTALDRIGSGDVLFLRGGVYRDKLILKTSGTRQNPTVVMAYPGEHVELVGANVQIADRVEYAVISGINQHHTSNLTDGLYLGEYLSHVSIWDCSFTDNTSPFENGTYNMAEGRGAGVRVNAVRYDDTGESPIADHAKSRRYLEFSHVFTARNDVDAFTCSGITYGRYQFCEGCWCPDATNPMKRTDFHQFRHANGFNSTNTAYRWNTLTSGETTFLFCLSHHNGQDGWDYQSPNPRLFGCVTYGEAASSIPYGGVGLKFWEYNNTLVNCVTYCNNINDLSGSGMAFNAPEDGTKRFNYLKYTRLDTLVANCAFFHCHSRCIGFTSDVADHIRIENCVFERSTEIFTRHIMEDKRNGHNFINNNIMWNIYDTEITYGAKETEPGFLDPENGCFFPKEGANMLTEGNVLAYSFDVDGVDYALLDGLGRPRNSTAEAGPYTRYDRDIVEHV